MSDKPQTADWRFGLVGALCGALAGYFGFFLLTRLGFYAMVLPGALLGLGCGLLSGGKSDRLAVFCGIAGVLLGLFTEWRFAPFVADASLLFFIANIKDLSPVTLISIAVGGVMAYWFGRGREGRVWQHHTAPAPVIPAARNMTDMRATANAHIRRDLEAGGKWLCTCPDCHEIRALIGVDKTLEVRPLVRRILRLEEQLETMPHGPAKQVVLDDYLKAYDELAEVMARE